MSEKFGPCLDKKCSWCCDPVKVSSRFPEEEIPKDKDGNLIWKKRDEIIAPEETWEVQKLKTFDCVKYNKNSGLCEDYDNRPEICKETSCIDENSSKTIDEQHKETINSKFIKIK